MIILSVGIKYSLRDLLIMLDLHIACAPYGGQTIGKNTKLRLYTSVVIPTATAIYAGETWKTTEKTRRMLDVFNRRCLRNILGISWKDHVTNADLLHETGMMNLQDIVADRRRRFIGHILRLPPSRPASTALQWIPEKGNKRKGRPKKTWQD